MAVRGQIQAPEMYSWGERPQYSMAKRLSGPQRGYCGEETNLLLLKSNPDSLIIQPVVYVVTTLRYFVAAHKTLSLYALKPSHPPELSSSYSLHTEGQHYKHKERQISQGIYHDHVYCVGHCPPYWVLFKNNILKSGSVSAIT
jgi:hypothetical protein